MRGWKKALSFAAALIPVGLIGGWFVMQYQMNLFDPAVLAQAVGQLGSEAALVVIGMVQTVCYAVFCGFFGYFLSEKLGLIRPLRLERGPAKQTFLLSILGGVVFCLDPWVFGRAYPTIVDSALAGLNFSGVMASVLYGGMIEEVMMRLFLMSLLAWLIWKLGFRKSSTVPTGVLVAGNILTALLFAAGHLPATISTFGELNALLLVRCFLLNGGFGLLFGWLYRKHGIQYAMLSHIIFHLISKAIWFLFL